MSDDVSQFSEISVDFELSSERKSASKMKRGLTKAILINKTKLMRT